MEGASLAHCGDSESDPRGRGRLRRGAASAINLQGACAGPAADAGTSRCARWPACGASSGCCRATAGGPGATVIASAGAGAGGRARPGPGLPAPGGPVHGTRSGGGPPGPELEPRRPGRRLGVRSLACQARPGPVRVAQAASTQAGSHWQVRSDLLLAKIQGHGSYKAASSWPPPKYHHPICHR